VKAPLYDVVIPTIGRRGLSTLLSRVFAEAGNDVGLVVVIDDRPMRAAGPLPGCIRRDDRLRVHRSGGRGPATARNIGIRHSNAPWVVFVDDDVELPEGWGRALERDLRCAAKGVGGVQARVVVPLASNRLTDWQRNVAALEGARWRDARQREMEKKKRLQRN